ncbi:MAG: hypothetical protein ACE5NM_10525 [Sedimentisphaerales bacterium]
MGKPRHFWERREFCLAMSLTLGLMLIFSQPGWAAQNENVHHYKLLSALEYNGKSQFRNQVETLCTVRKVISGDKVQYFLSTDNCGSVGDNRSYKERSFLKELSFVIDGRTQFLSATGKDLAFLEKVTNQCVKTLKKVKKDNVGKTWKQGFDLSCLGDSVPRELKFTLTAIRLKTKALGEMIAVRALSEPFFVKTAKDKDSVGSVQSKINSVYVFDPEFEDIYLSLSVFKTTTNINGFNETLQHIVATCKADNTGQPVDFSNLGKDKDFEKLTSKLGLTSNLKVVKASSLPRWAQAEGIRAAQVANICAAVSCEGALNPVAMVFLPAARTVQLQSFSEPITTSAQLAGSGGGGLENMFDWFGWNWQTAAWGAGITFGTLGAAGAFDDEDTKYRSPTN